MSDWFEYASRPLGPKSTLDIEDLTRKYKFIDQNNTPAPNHFDAHPKVKHFAPARTTKNYNAVKGDYQRFDVVPKSLTGDWSNSNSTVLSEREAMLEAARCLKCTNAPCISACPSSVDIPNFIQAIENGNFYTAARLIQSANSNGKTCGSICATSDLCSGSCTLATPTSKGINIEGLQAFALEKFAQMNIPATVDPAVQVPADVRSTKIAVVGAGPAGLSCATFLARYGYTNIVVFDRERAAGGINTFELPEFRLPHEDVKFEVELLTQLGVKFTYGKTFVSDLNNIETQISYEQLKGDGFGHIFLAFGRPSPIILDMFKPLSPSQGLYNAKDFLPITTIQSKPSLKVLYPEAEKLPDFSGKRVLVLGGGDVAVDSATTSLRLGATQVSIVFRKNTTDMRCMVEERRHAEHEKIDFIPYCAPSKVILNDAGSLKAIEFSKQSQDATGKYVTDEDELIRLRADIVITAFGCKAIGVDKLVPDLKLQRDGCIQVDDFGRTNIPGIYAGGDLIGASTTVGASNDGKVAAWAIHCAITGGDVEGEIQLPNFHTAIDDVDLSVCVDGVKYPNPFCLASAPPCTSKTMIARAFEMGWGGAVVKTFVLDKDMVTNVSGRITASTQGSEDYHNSKRSWFNIELVTEKGAAYWYQAMRELREQFPDKVVIASAMCGYSEEDWTEVVTKSILLGRAKAIELNLSCPHMDGSGLALAIGQCAESVEVVVGWCVKAARSIGADDIPIYAKLTPNHTEISDLALAAERGLNYEGRRHPGGVTAINTVSGIIGFKFDGSAMKHGVLNDETGVVSSGAGGYCGAGVRPLSFKAVVNIKRATPVTTVLATGGIETANIAYQFMMAGAPILQICSAVMNRDYSIVQDLIYGLKALLYIKHREDGEFKGWTFQQPLDTQKDRVSHKVIKFGKLLRNELDSESTPRTKANPVWKINTRVEDDFTLKTSIPQLPEGATTNQTKTAKTAPGVGVGVAAHVGKAVVSFVDHTELSRYDQTVALINDDNCIRCGRCYVSCNDSGYQAIEMNPVTRQVVVKEDACTSCGICESVCPYPQVISFVGRSDAKIVATYRGADIAAKVLAEYPHGVLTPELIAKAQLQNQQADAQTKKTGCQSTTCCGGSCSK